jgi:hypothetical protein
MLLVLFVPLRAREKQKHEKTYLGNYTHSKIGTKNPKRYESTKKKTHTRRRTHLSYSWRANNPIPNIPIGVSRGEKAPN